MPFDLGSVPAQILSVLTWHVCKGCSAVPKRTTQHHCSNHQPRTQKCTTSISNPNVTRNKRRPSHPTSSGHHTPFGRMSAASQNTAAALKPASDTGSPQPPLPQPSTAAPDPPAASAVADRYTDPISASTQSASLFPLILIGCCCDSAYRPTGPAAAAVAAVPAC
jgi:hypothetical protein